MSFTTDEVKQCIDDLRRTADNQEPLATAVAFVMASEKLMDANPLGISHDSPLWAFLTDCMAVHDQVLRELV